ncbi:MAG: tRNA pseudouridine(54/55) synthase Pus10 [Candidatus Aenigmarchaeota archaeon]|nr:tRNA pseudouridine(54/55) synthase Pus10 [Candidatus Aenigmarchaeota archaeon]
MLMKKAEIILKKYVCDHCLGRQFGQLLSGHDNSHRGRIIRSMIAMSIDKEKLDSDQQMSMLNFVGFKFHFLQLDIQALKEEILKRKCSVCDDVFRNLDQYADVAEKMLKGIEFKSFLIGTHLSHDLSAKEEILWEKAGIDWCEPIKAELNREIGKKIENKLKKKADIKSPEVAVLIDIENKKANVQINPFFVYGEYQKLVRGIPQTKWPDKRYKTSVEEIIAKPFMRAAKAKGHKLHGLGREDIDARCLGWRPFVLELLEPMKRPKNIKSLAKKIGKHVRARNIRASNIAEVRKIKEARTNKTYRCFVVCEKPVNKNDLEKLKHIKEISQRTPTRVMHRRPDLKRRRKVLSIKTKLKNNRLFELIVKTEAGLYVKELISGDGSRTQPSISEILGMSCKCRDLDVIQIEKPGKK